jgi:glutamate carboxypeptidase
VTAKFASVLDWIDSQRDRMIEQVVQWSNINSGTMNVDGLERFAAVLREAFATLGGQMSAIELPPAESVDDRGQNRQSPLGKAISIIKRPNAQRRVFLCIHMDTVYPVDHPFQSCRLLDGGKLHGPGVADAKGGLVVMLTALQALERSDLASQIGWEVLINPDEEIGSPGSSLLLIEAARRNRWGLLFEPAMEDGSLVDRRKGAGNYSVVVHGRSAHAGRDFPRGRNAVVAACELAAALHAVNGLKDGVTINIGKIDGGGPPNVVPDLAICRMNLRTTVPEDEAWLLARIEPLVAAVNQREGFSAQLHGGFFSPPKIPDAQAKALMELIAQSGSEVGVTVNYKSSGGTSDGNKLAAAGLPNVDTLGVWGGSIHSPDEFMRTSSLAERAKLTALTLLKLAGGEL